MEDSCIEECICLAWKAQKWYERLYLISRASLTLATEYAAAFFLLADHLKDAVNVILNQLKDLQLAIAVTRVYEGEGGPVLKELLQEKVLPLAAQEGNRWLASWAFWMLHRRDMSVRALIVRPFLLLPRASYLHTTVASLHAPRKPSNTRSPSKALPGRRSSPCGPVLAAPTKDAANPPRRLKGHAESRVGIRAA